jgi:hypothetical protein
VLHRVALPVPPNHLSRSLVAVGLAESKASERKLFQRMVSALDGNSPDIVAKEVSGSNRRCVVSNTGQAHCSKILKRIARALFQLCYTTLNESLIDRGWSVRAIIMHGG